MYGIGRLIVECLVNAILQIVFEQKNFLLRENLRFGKAKGINLEDVEQERNWRCFINYLFLLNFSCCERLYFHVKCMLLKQYFAIPKSLFDFLKN